MITRQKKNTNENTKYYLVENTNFLESFNSWAKDNFIIFYFHWTWNKILVIISSGEILMIHKIFWQISRARQTNIKMEFLWFWTSPPLWKTFLEHFLEDKCLNKHSRNVSFFTVYFPRKTDARVDCWCRQSAF